MKTMGWVDGFDVAESVDDPLALNLLDIQDFDFFAATDGGEADSSSSASAAASVTFSDFDSGAVQSEDSGGGTVADLGGTGIATLGVTSLSAASFESSSPAHVFIAVNETELGTCACPDCGTGPTDNAEAVVGTYNQLRDFLTTGYWTWSGGGTRKWADPFSITINYNDLPALDRAMVDLALALYDDIGNMNFSVTAGAADITFINDNSGAYCSSSVTGGFINSSLVNIEAGWSGGPTSRFHGYRFQTFIHEIGHALGLGHQGRYNGSASYPSDAAYENDSWQLSIMSYFDQIENTYVNGSFAYVLTPQLIDIMAIHALYGAPALTRTGNNTYGVGNNTGRAVYDAWASGNFPTVTIYDDGGTDTLNYSGYAGSQTINLTPGGFSSVYGETNNIIIYTTTTIENAVGGSGSDTIYGNSAANTLTGNGGADTLYGGDLGDLLYGGSGGDSLYGGAGGDTLYGGGGGTDWVYGGNGTDYLVGGDSLSYLYGGGDGLADYFYGGSGTTYAYGGTAADYYYSGSGTDVFYGADGNDTAYGGGGVDYIYGGEGNDTVYGGSDNDYLYSGGDGSYYGGTGDDRIYAGLTSSSELLDGGDGIDTLDTTTFNGTYSINMVTGVTNYNESFLNFEYLTTGNGADTVTGTAASNLIITNGGNDVVYAGDGNDNAQGGTGSDTLFGGNGFDYLYGGDDGDYINGQNGGGGSGDAMYGGGGNDTLQDTSNDFADFFSGGDGADSIYAGGMGDIIYGDAGNDLVEAGGGADLVYGGTGDDTLNGGAGGDSLNGDAGQDSIYGGDDNDFLFGQGDTDYLHGGLGNDFLYGGDSVDTLNGFNGDDQLYGGGGGDWFGFQINFGIDVVNDFDDGGTNDILSIESIYFANYAAVQAAMSQVGAHAFINAGGGNAIWILNTNIANLGADDFYFF